MVAFQRGYYDIARLLIENGAALDAFCKKNGVTPREIMPKDFDLVKAKENDIVKDFFWKIRDGKFEDVKLFLENAPRTILNKNLVIKGTLYPLPLLIAFKKNRLDIARFLIEKGADIEAYCNKYELFVKEIVPEKFQLSS